MITAEQIKEARQTLTTAGAIVMRMVHCLNVAEKKVLGVALSATQKTAIKDEYTECKALLKEAYKSLP